MVTPSSELANTLFSINLNTYITPITNNNQINMKVDSLRERSVLSNINSLRKLLAHSSIFSISYVERMEAQSNNLS